MRGGQPPLAPKSSHKVLRSFPPPHRLRGKPLKIPKKPRPPAVIPASFAKQNLVSTRMRATHCEEPVQGDVAIVYILSLRGFRSENRGNPLTSVHFLDCFARNDSVFTHAKTVHKKILRITPRIF